MKLRRPATADYDQYYAGYLARAEDDPLAQLAAQAEEVESFASVGDDTASKPPAAGEWTLKEILGHLCDFERVFAYRVLRFSRGDRAPLAGFDQDPYVAAGGANGRPLGELVREFGYVRSATLLFFGSLTEEMLDRSGIVSGNAVTVRALVFITAGHCAGHLADIRRDYPVAAPAR